MAITLYELAGADPDRRFSPYVWRIRMALAHKGLDYEGVPWRFTEKDMIAFSGQGKVPVLVDGDEVVSDSWAIATYLEDSYPDRPSLFGGATGRAGARFVQDWFETAVFRHIAKLVIKDVHDHLGAEDQRYFRETREKRFGKTLEELCPDEAAAVEDLRVALTPLRTMLAHQPYIAGDAPGYADYVPFAGLQWARCISPKPLLKPGDPVHDWRERLLDAHGGMARAAKCHEAAA